MLPVEFDLFKHVKPFFFNESGLAVKSLDY